MRRILLVLTLFFSVALIAQNDQKHYIIFAEEAMESGDYFGAARYYKKALSADPGDIDLQYKYAESLRLTNNYVDAEDWYTRVYKKERGRYYPKGAYWIAHLKVANGEYEDAIKFWDRVARAEPESSSIHKRAMQRIASCRWAMENEKDSLAGLLVNNLGEIVNSPESEFGVHLLADSTLVFASLRGEYNKVLELADTSNYSIRLYKASLNELTAATILDSALMVSDALFANATFNKAETEMYFSKCGENGPCAIYRSVILDGKFGPAEKLDQKINAPSSSSTQPQLVEFNGRSALFFCSDRQTGEGGMDIYLSELNADGFSTPRNLGASINTIDNEISPHYNPEMGELYFSSDWHEGFGLMDIFKAKGSVDDGFRDPVNLGQPFNSSVNDMYFQMKADSTGFLTSNRPGSYSLKGETCCNDIYSFKMGEDLIAHAPEEKIDSTLITQIDPDSPLPETIGSVSDLTDYLPITLYFHNDRPNPKSTASTTRLTYSETFEEYNALRETYEMAVQEGLSRPSAIGAREEIRTFFDEMQRENERLDGVCRLLLDELNKGKQIELAIKGYASPLAQSDYNKFLTKRRIESLVNYFQSWENGTLLPFINASSASSGSLTFQRIPFGESNAQAGVSDQQNDRNSIYSIQAARERRIEILRISER